MDKAVLRKLQTIELEILIEIDNYCKSNNINYSLYGGTLLGAVRHKGFIPWDDDVDIVMTRGEFTKFCTMWLERPIKGFYLEYFETNKNTQNTHAKIRKDGTMLLSHGENENTGHHGIWIDIFVFDKVPEYDSLVMKKARQMILMVKANGILPGEPIKKKVARTLLRIRYPAFYRQKKLLAILFFFRENNMKVRDDFHYCDFCTLEYLKIEFPEHTGYSYSSLPFEGYYFSAFSNYDEILRIMYGDYMQLPPIEERICKHNPKKIVF